VIRIIIAGDSGFIGRQLVHRLREQGSRRTDFRQNVGSSFPQITIQGDVRDKDAWWKHAKWPMSYTTLSPNMPTM
jgi:nucleoside-diphosphate-sugar epimerase